MNRRHETLKRTSAPATSSSAAARADVRAKAKKPATIPSLTPGDRVLHDTFGMGTVITIEGTDDKTVASIDFGSEGDGRLLLRYAPVEKLWRPRAER